MGQSRMGNPETRATFGTKHNPKTNTTKVKTKNTTNKKEYNFWDSLIKDYKFIKSEVWAFVVVIVWQLDL